MLTFADTEIEHNVLTGLGEDDLVASQVREFMFTWEDLSSIEKRGCRRSRPVDTRTLSIALKACSSLCSRM